MSDEPEDDEYSPEAEFTALPPPHRFRPELHVVPVDWRGRAEAVMEPFIAPQTALAWIYIRDDEALAGLEEMRHGRFTAAMGREKNVRPTYFDSLDDAERALLKACRSGQVRAHASAGDSIPRKKHMEMSASAWIGLTLVPMNETYVAGPEPGHVAPNFHNLVFERNQVLESWPPLSGPPANEQTPSAAAEDLPAPLGPLDIATPRRRGPKPVKRAAIEERMIADLQSGKFTLEELRDMKGVALAQEYGATRNTVDPVRKRVCHHYSKLNSDKL